MLAKLYFFPIVAVTNLQERKNWYGISREATFSWKMDFMYTNGRRRLDNSSADTAKQSEISAKHFQWSLFRLGQKDSGLWLPVIVIYRDVHIYLGLTMSEGQFAYRRAHVLHGLINVICCVKSERAKMLVDPGFPARNNYSPMYTKQGQTNPKRPPGLNLRDWNRIKPAPRAA